MKKILFYFTLLSLLLSAKAEVFNKSPFDISFASRSKYGAKATGEIARRYHFPADKTLDEKDWYINYRYTGNILLTPAGQWGLLLASVKDKPFLVVYETITGGLGKSAGLLKWDEIIAVNGRSLPPMESGWGSGEGPISIFGDELYRCEAKGDVMKLTVRRQGKVLDITAKVQLKEQQPEKLLALILEDIARAQAPDGSWQGDVYSKSYSGAFLALALLSGGNAEHLPMVKKTVNYLLTHDHAMEWSWMRAIATILMAEYFAASGDMEIYPHLQAWTDMLTYEYANIYGGFGHKREAAGTYGEKSFGAPAVLIHLAWSLAAECGCRIDPQLRKRSLKYIIGKANLESSHFISYRGLARKGGKTAKESYFMDQGECGFRNGALALALNLSGDEKKLKNSIIQFMKEYYKDLCYVHSLPSHGMIFGSLALATCAPQAYKTHFNYRKWHLAISRMPDNSLQYVTPKSSRYALPSGGGWDGDTGIGQKNMAYAQYALLLSAPQNKLLMSCNKELGWLSGQKQVREEVKVVNEKRAEKMFRQGAQLQRENKHFEALEIFQRLVTSWKPYASADQAADQIKAMRSQSALWEKVQIQLNEKIAMQYFKAGVKPISKQLERLDTVEYIISHFPTTKAAKLATEDLIKYARKMAVQQKADADKKKAADKVTSTKPK